VCNQGFTGVDCNTPLLSLQESHVQESHAQPQTVHRAKNLSLAVGKTEHGQAYVPPHQKNKVAPPTGGQFGIPEVNDIGHTGVQIGKCDDNCNFRGVCQDGECFCQPGFYGKKCGMVKTSEKGTVSLAVLLLVGGGCAVVSFSIMTLLLHLSMQSKRAKENELGYNV